MNENDRFWCLGFFESQASFTVNIGLPKTKYKRYLIFKPYIVIANTDEHQVNFIKKILGLDFSNASKKKKKATHHNITYSLNIQNFDDIDKILEVISGTKFKSKKKQDRLIKFKLCYNNLKKYDKINLTWRPEFRELIKQKLDINKARSNIDVNRFSDFEWEERIKEHLNGNS